MNILEPVDELIDVTCPVCLQRGRLRAEYRGEWVRCKRCRGRFEVPEAGLRLGISWPVLAPGTGPVGARVGTLGVAGPVAEERTSPPLRVFTG